MKTLKISLRACGVAVVLAVWFVTVFPQASFAQTLIGTWSLNLLV